MTHAAADTSRIPISVAGSPRLAPQVDGHFALLSEDERPIDAVVRSIERRTRTTCCAGPRLDSWCPGGGTRTYQATFGRPADGGYNVAGELWIYV